MIIQRIVPGTNLNELKGSLRDRVPERQHFNRFAIVTAAGADGVEHSFLIGADAKKDKRELVQFDTARKVGADSMVTLAVTDGGQTHHVTGRLVDYYKAPGTLRQVGSILGYASANISAMFLGLAATGLGLTGGEVGMFGGAALAGIGALSTVAGGIGFWGHQVQRSDGLDRAAREVAKSCEPGTASASIVRIEAAPKPVLALPEPTPPVVLPQALLGNREPVLEEAPRLATVALPQLTSYVEGQSTV